MRAATERVEGLDKNVIISNYKQEALDKFLINYNEYIQPTTIFKTSPSLIILDYIKNLKSE